MNQNKERKNLQEILLNSSTVTGYVDWVCSNFVYNGVNIWRRTNLVNGAVNYTKEQLIKQYLNENC